jgi:RNA polymerase sigma-70 factor, ECF subfamily
VRPTVTRTVAKQALALPQRARFVRSALVNGTAGVVADTGGRLLAVMGFTVRGGKILEIDILADSARLRRFDLPVPHT